MKLAPISPSHAARLSLAALLMLAFVTLSGAVLALWTVLHSDPPADVIEACLRMMHSGLQLFSSYLSSSPFVTQAAIFFALFSFFWALTRSAAAIFSSGRAVKGARPYRKGGSLKLDAILAEKLPLSKVPIRTLDSGGPQAFTGGLLRPRIYLSLGLIEALSQAELQTVLLHELAHLEKKDPLKLLAARFVADALWFIPLARRLASTFADAAEKAADDHAVVYSRRPLDLASAIVKVAKEGLALKPAPSLGSLSVEERVMRLLGAQGHPGAPCSLKSLLASGVILMVLMSALTWPLAASGLSTKTSQALIPQWSLEPTVCTFMDQG